MEVDSFPLEPALVVLDVLEASVKCAVPPDFRLRLLLDF